MLLSLTEDGVTCERAGFTVDPTRPVETAILTHLAHATTVPECDRLIASTELAPFLTRPVEAHPYGERFLLGGDTTVSLHPSGFTRGAAQVRIEAGDESAIAIGPHKRVPDPTCAPFEPMTANEVALDATFALPIYRWDPPAQVAKEVLAWWDEARLEDAPCVILGPAFGAAQRLLALLAELTDRPVLLHPDVARWTPSPAHVTDVPRKGELLLVPEGRPAPWKKARVALLSGAARVRGVRRRRSYDRGFVLEDRADWPALVRTVEESRARRVLPTGTYAHVLARFLRERGVDA